MPAATRRRTYWLLQALGWTCWGLIGIALVSLFGRFSWLLVGIEGIVAVVTMLGSHGLRGIIRRRGWVGMPLLRLLPRLLAAIAGVAAGSIVGIGLLVTGILWLRHQLGGHFPWVDYVGYYINTCLALTLWSVTYLGVHYFERYRSAEVDRWRLAATAREAEMQALKAQLNPHFLFNGLNNIRALVMEDPTRARTMMTHLAELLRYTMQHNGAVQVSLATELAIVQDYLQLETLQLEHRLHYSLDVPPDTLAISLPPMSLQLLVENALKHGVAPRPAGGRVALAAQLEDAQLLLSVRSTGSYQPAAGHAGVGLRNLRERLNLLFGTAASFRIGPDPLLPDTVLAEISLPAVAPAAAVHPSPTGLPFLHESPAY